MIALEFDFNTRDRASVGLVFIPLEHRYLCPGDKVCLFDPGEPPPGVSALGVIREINRASAWVARVVVDMESIGEFPRR